MIVDGTGILVACKIGGTGKPFGFLRPEDGGRDLYIHAGAFERCGLPVVGTRLRYRLQISNRNAISEFEVMNDEGESE